MRVLKVLEDLLWCYAVCEADFITGWNLWHGLWLCIAECKRQYPLIHVCVHVFLWSWKKLGLLVNYKLGTIDNIRMLYGFLELGNCKQFSEEGRGYVFVPIDGSPLTVIGLLWSKWSVRRWITHLWVYAGKKLCPPLHLIFQVSIPSSLPCWSSWHRVSRTTL